MNEPVTRTHELIGAVLDQLVQLPVSVASLPDGGLDVRVLLNQISVGHVGLETCLRLGEDDLSDRTVLTRPAGASDGLGLIRTDHLDPLSSRTHARCPFK